MYVSMKRSVSVVGFGVVTVALLALATFAVAAQADNGYDVRALRGVYGFAGSAVVLPPAAPASTPAVVVGTWTFAVGSKQ